MWFRGGRKERGGREKLNERKTKTKTKSEAEENGSKENKTEGKRTRVVMHR